ncbi:MAG: hypothetical protein SXV54_14670 [Chloroflexota bacterium]|nr:hypothetical protein [Chloroflexota bacterium]
MDEIEKRRNTQSRLRVFAGLVAVAFAVTLAVVIGNRLNDESLAVLAGAVCGVGAAIPTSLLIVAVSRRRDEPRVQPAMPMSQSQGPYPPVVVIAPPGGQQPGANFWNALPPSLSAPTQRHFTVVGGSPVDTDVSSQ